MKRIIGRIIFFTVMNLLFIPIAPSQELPKVMREENIVRGKSHVGFKLIHTYDSTRTFAGENNEITCRPIQMAVWYPADMEHVSKRLRFSDYFKAQASVTDFKYMVDQKARASIADAYEKFYADRTQKVNVVDKVFNYEMDVWDDPPSHAGKYPLIIYACGFGNSFYENTILCEYLASHGNIVVSFPTHGRKERQMTSDKTGIETQTRDIEFVMSRMLNDSHVDRSMISIIGFSWGGVSNVIAAMRNENVKRVVSIDGSIIYGGAPEIIQDYYAYTPATFSVPFLFIKRANETKYNFDFYNKINCPKNIISYANLSHDDLTSICYYIPFADRTEREYKLAWEQYKDMCKQILEFLK